MRLLHTALLVALAATGGAAQAETLPLASPYAPLKLVAIMADTGQVLVFSETAQEYRAVKVGEEIERWRVLSIDTALGKAVVAQDSARDELSLAAAPKPIHLLAAAAPATPAPAPAPAPAPVPVAVAPTLPPPPPTPPPLPAPRVVEETHRITHVDLSRELDDFDRLLASITVAPAAGGGFSLLRLDARSWVATLGLHEGDIVRTVDGERVSTVSDAARVYARIATASGFTVEVDRGRDRVVLHYDVK